MLKILNILPVQLDDSHNDTSCSDDVHDDHDDDEDSDQEVGCTLNVDGTLVAQLPPLDPGKRITTVSQNTFKEGGWGAPEECNM